MKRYAIVIEWAGANLSGYVPDLPGCVSTGESIGETKAALREAIELHIEGLREDRSIVPAPTTHVDYLEARSAS